MGKLDQVDLTQEFEDKRDYNQQLKKWQLRLLELEEALRNKALAVLIAFEGWDASGKGGAIKRLTGALDPRGYKVYSVCAPTEEEKAHHYLWRFWTHTPKKGELVIFDRSWYGRVLVERVEGFAKKPEWQRAYEEINCFEEQLRADGTVTIKFWLHISPEEQLRRFKEREANPFKRYKIGPDDWRNREKWDKYLVAAEAMFKATDKAGCPWHLVSGEHKWWARVEVLKTVVKRMEKTLGKDVAD
jgi:AMP-polyphosphate phosphotransferase